MSKPAARIGDMTAHGGVVTLGQPTVLIGGMPAARATDMHACPMFNGPQPHVGGPITMGSPTVLIGGMPAARMGDMATCAGPPDTIVMGCFTVLIGAAGSGAAGGGGGGGSSAAAAQASAATAQFDNNESTTKEEHWVEFEFVDEAGLPVSGVSYAFEDPDGNTEEGRLRMDGTVRRDALSEGQAKVVLKEVYEAEWDASKISVDDKVKAQAKADGFEDGTPARINVFERDLHGADVIVADLKTKVSGGKVEATWRYEYPEAATQASDEEAETTASSGDEYAAPAYYFEAVVGSCAARSALLDVSDYIEIELLDGEGQPIKNQEYVLRTASGEVRKGTLDGSGTAREEKIPPAHCEVRFPQLPDLDAEAESVEGEQAEEPGSARAGDDDADEETQIQIQVHDLQDEPLGGVAYTLEVGSRVIEGTTDRKGWIEPFDPAGASEATLEVDDLTFNIELREAANEVERAQAMLNALGFGAGPLDGDLGTRTRAALEAYQEARYLKVSGELDDTTLRTLSAEFEQMR